MSGRRIPASLRKRVRKRASDRCEYCQFPGALFYKQFHSDHVRPVSRGGLKVLANLAWACPNCNAGKHDRARGTDRVTGREADLFTPRADRWSEHFAWSANGLTVRGRTATGRVTVRVLKMNAPDLKSVRTALLHADPHPRQA